MRRISTTIALLAILSLAFLSGPVQGARRKPLPLPRTYQVTGPVLELTSDTIVVQKGKERWEIARDSNTRVDGELKVGAQVTIQYRMTAASINVRPAKPAGAAKAKTPPKKP